MERYVGTVARSIRAPIIKSGDNLVEIVCDTLTSAAKSEGFKICDRDIVAVTEAVLARSQNNYATVDDIAGDIIQKFGGGEIGLVFPILSRNRFATCLKGIAKGAKKIILMLSYPSDEVGNELISLEKVYDSNLNPHTDVLSLAAYRKLFGDNKHPFTGIDYVSYYGDIITQSGAEAEIIFANNPRAILDYTKNILTCDIHTRALTKKILRKAGAEKLYNLEDILSSPRDGGYNESYGLLGANKATEEKVKLFPRMGDDFVLRVQSRLKTLTGSHVEVMVYGDGAFKDPAGHIWELADPVVSPGYTKGLEGTPNEVKLKYLADNNFSHLSGGELRKAIEDYIKNKEPDLVGSMESQGTTPRRLTDLIGSLCDLISGSGDKGTPFILIQGYFDNYAT
ncbi:MAG: coenzyme F420-0:L-glutamate ligase [Eubacteriales bacterium]